MAETGCVYGLKNFIHCLFTVKTVNDSCVLLFRRYSVITEREGNVMDIIVNRDSVCLGDDMDDHSKKYFFDNNATYEDLFNHIKQDYYFPSIAGNNVVWVLTTERFSCIFSYFTKTNKFSMGLTEKKLNKLFSSNDEVYLRYYTSPIKWKEAIMEMYHNDLYSLWRDGWTEEIEYCDYVDSLT